MKKRKTVAVLTPTRDGLVDISYTQSLVASIRELSDEYDIQPTLISGVSDITTGRNKLWNLWYQTDVDFCLWVDSDISWNPIDLKNMLESPVAVIGGNYAKKEYNHEAFLRYASLQQNHLGEINVKEALEASFGYVSTGSHSKYIEGESKGLMSVEGVGLGFLLISRIAADELMNWAAINMQKLSMESLSGKRIKGYPVFNPVTGLDIDGEDVGYGEDFSFCKRLNESGVKIFIDPSMRLRHSGYHVFDSCFDSFLKMSELSSENNVQVPREDYKTPEEIIESKNDKK
jgi:hypothetical protein